MQADKPSATIATLMNSMYLFRFLIPAKIPSLAGKSRNEKRKD